MPPISCKILFVPFFALAPKEATCSVQRGFHGDLVNTSAADAWTKSITFTWRLRIASMVITIDAQYAEKITTWLSASRVSASWRCFSVSKPSKRFSFWLGRVFILPCCPLFWYNGRGCTKPRKDASYEAKDSLGVDDIWFFNFSYLRSFHPGNLPEQYWCADSVPNHAPHRCWPSLYFYSSNSLW